MTTSLPTQLNNSPAKPIDAENGFFHCVSLGPIAFTEDKIDFEVLKLVLGGTVDEREEKYGLNWNGKRRARQLALIPSTGTLRPCPEDSVDWDTTQNLMIEGDNLEVLKLLQKSYSGKVKLIYIDPPYNTGNDFVYPDDFQDKIKNYLRLTGQIDGTGHRVSSNTESSGRFHTDWLNMMYPRLRLARNLLREDGVIFISIDDNEAHNLRQMMNEIFGEENFVANVVWNHTKQSKNDERFFSHDTTTRLWFLERVRRWLSLGSLALTTTTRITRTKTMIQRASGGREMFGARTSGQLFAIE